MCMVSKIGDGFMDQFPNKWPQITPSTSEHIVIPPEISRAEFNALRAEMNELKKLLLAAKKFDEVTGQPDCEMEDKVKLIKAIAKMAGVDLGDVFGPTKSD